MPPAGAGDAPVADLSLLRDVATELVQVLVVDLFDLVLAEEAALAPAGGQRGARALARLLCLGLGHVSPITECRRRLSRQRGSRRWTARPLAARTAGRPR